MKCVFFVVIAASVLTAPAYANPQKLLTKQEVQARHEICLRHAFTSTDIFRPGMNGLPVSQILYEDCIREEKPEANFQTAPENSRKIANQIKSCGGVATITETGNVFIENWVSLNCFERGE